MQAHRTARQGGIPYQQREDRHAHTDKGCSLHLRVQAEYRNDQRPAADQKEGLCRTVCYRQPQGVQDWRELRF